MAGWIQNVVSKRLALFLCYSMRTYSIKMPLDLAQTAIGHH